jgi:hypothetical protein
MLWSASPPALKSQMVATPPVDDPTQQEREATFHIELVSFNSFLIFLVVTPFSQPLPDGIFFDIKQSSQSKSNRRLEAWD